jgi:hypothetical protein
MKNILFFFIICTMFALCRWNIENTTLNNAILVVMFLLSAFMVFLAFQKEKK